MSYETCSVDACEKLVPQIRHRIGMCEGHYKRQWRHGDPQAGRTPNGTPIADKFWQYVERGKPGECWEWIGGRMHGYGATSVHGKTRAAHRVAWELANGPIPDGLSILHICDNPPCVNVMHMFAGTTGDNNRDRHDKGRTVMPNNRGSRHGMAKLTEDAVRDIHRLLRSGESQSQIAAKFGVNPSVVSKIQSRKAWTHVSEVS